MTKELTHIFHVNRITIYHWFNDWELRHFSGLYDRKRQGRHPILHDDQKTQIRAWVKMFPKNLNKVRALIQEKFDLEVSKQTMKRILRSWQFTWRHIRRRVKGQPNPRIYQERKETLDILIDEDKDGIIDLRYFDESGFCFITYVPYAWHENGATIARESTPSTRLNILGFMNKRNE